VNESEAKSKAIKTTEYCHVVAQAWEGVVGDSVCLERIFVKGGCEEIRLAWWKNGNQTNRPADINAIDWVPLFSAAVRESVFTDREQLGMLKALLK
jgi:hypothetical protein